LELPALKSSILGRDASGKFTPYATAVAQFLAKYA
jgi:hypothetical protein